MTKTHYDNLKIAQTASKKEIKTAYKSLAQKWHPDKNTRQLALAENNIKIINEAYRVLSDTKLRQQHDAWIQKTKTQAVAQSTGDHHTDRQHAGYNTSRRRKSSTPQDSMFVVSKKKLRLFLLVLVSIPALVTMSVLIADRFPVLNVLTPKPAVSNVVSANGKFRNTRDIESELQLFFSRLQQTLVLVTDSRTAILALPGLGQSMRYIVDYAEQLERSDRASKIKASEAVSIGMRSLRTELIRLQNDSRVWLILNPTLSPVVDALRRIAG